MNKRHFIDYVVVSHGDFNLGIYIYSIDDTDKRKGSARKLFFSSYHFQHYTLQSSNV